LSNWNYRNNMICLYNSEMLRNGDTRRHRKWYYVSAFSFQLK
jgi:hypothetical protein